MTKIQVCLGILEKRDTDFRDNVNKWFGGTISTILTKKEQEKKEKNKVFYLKINMILKIKYWFLLGIAVFV